MGPNEELGEQDYLIKGQRKEGRDKKTISSVACK